MYEEPLHPTVYSFERLYNLSNHIPSPIIITHGFPTPGPGSGIGP